MMTKPTIWSQSLSPLSTRTNYPLLGFLTLLLLSGFFSATWIFSFFKALILVGISGLAIVLIAKFIKNQTAPRHQNFSYLTNATVLAIIGLYSVLHLSEIATETLYITLYGVIGFSSVLNLRSQALWICGYTLLLEFSHIILNAPFTESWSEGLTHSIFLLIFTGVGIITPINRSTSRQLPIQPNTSRSKHHKSHPEQDEDLTRLLKSKNSQMPTEKEIIDSVKAIHRSMKLTLNLLKNGLELHTAAVFWLSDKSTLTLKELVSEHPDQICGQTSPEAGVIGSVFRQKTTFVLKNINPNFRGLKYYSNTKELAITNFIGVPLIQDDKVKGILLADRRGKEPFETEEEKTLAQAGTYMIYEIKNEQLFTQVEQSRKDYQHFYQASGNLNSVVTLEEVCQVACSALKELAPFDVGAITLYDKTTKLHTVAHIQGCDTENYKDQTFKSTNSLVSLVIKNPGFAQKMPVKNPNATVLTQQIPLPPFAELLIFPLIRSNNVLGTIIAGSQENFIFTPDRIKLFRVISNHIAVSIENALNYRRVNEMATTDALTGLYNRRVFFQRLKEAIARATRHKKPIALIMSDIDHFKHVNDTYGHPMGDQVLKIVSKILEDTLRETDTIARYGGEEFVIILEDTDSPDAFQLTERFRNLIEAQQFKSDTKTFNITMSAGIAIFPQDSEEEKTLLDKADQALYWSKTNGRNQCTIFSKL